MELPDAPANILAVSHGGGFVQGILRREVEDLESDAAVLETVLEDADDAIAIHSILEHVCELLQRVGLTGLLESLPGFGLSRLDEVDEGDDIHALARKGAIASVDLLPGAALFSEVLDKYHRMLVVALQKAAFGRGQIGFDILFEVPLFGFYRHILSHPSNYQLHGNSQRRSAESRQ